MDSHALFKPLGLSILFVAFSAAFGVIFVRQVDDDLPLAEGVDCAFRPAVEDVWRADVATSFVVVLGVRVPSKN